MADQAPVAVFDSGLGGLSVLRCLRARLPQEDYLYHGDNLNAPYGLRPPEEIRALSLAAADRLMASGPKALVVACNTATGAALEALRAALPIPVIGIQPALQAAQALRRQGEILVLATPATLKAERYRGLLARHGERVISLPAPGLMEYVERGELSGPGLDAFLEALLRPWLGRRIDVVVLGCTHYPFLSGALQPFFPDAPLIDDGPRVAEELRAALAARGALAAGPRTGGLRLTSSAGEAAVDRMRRLLDG